MTGDDETAIAESILVAWQGHSCKSVVRYEYSWQFIFEPSGLLTAECPWRIITNGRIALCRSDDGQKFGLPKPVDARLAAEKLIVGKSIQSLTFDNVTGDLRICFEDDVRLELITDSSGYEAWQAGNTQDASLIVGTGGGRVAIWRGNS